MLDGARAKAVITSFHDQLYDADQYSDINKNTTLFPDFDPVVAQEMREELDRFVSHVIEQGGGVNELLTSTTTFVTPRIAAIYGIDVPDGLADGEFAEVTLDSSQRAGLLTLSGFLAWKGTETQPDTILRGVFVNRNIICQELGDPPDAAMGAELGDEITNRDKVDALTGEGTCGATCHGTFINPAGFAFENYDAIGAYRTEDNGEPVNAAATFPFEGGEQSYANAIELSQILAESEQVHACYAGFWLEYLLGRDREVEDDAIVALLAERSLGGASTREVVTELLVSDVFRYRLVTKEGE
jgi:hypothetical protein